MNKIHFYNATHRYDVMRNILHVYHWRVSISYESIQVEFETWLERLPTSIELWIEYLRHVNMSSQLSDVRSLFIIRSLLFSSFIE
jgi:hypothetical protein